jgi:O-antigen/teichoic acid export membrane protein
MGKNISESKKQKEDNLTAGAKGGAIAFSLKILNTALAFLNQIILARILGAGGIGEVILAITVVRISAQIAKFGMEETMMKFIPLYIDRNDESRLKGTIMFAVKFCLLFSVVFMLFVLAGSKLISINIFHTEGLIKLMPVVVIAIPAWVIRDVIGGILRGYKDIRSALIPEALVSPFFRITVFLILILNGASPLFAIVAFVAGEIAAVIVSIIFLRKKVKILTTVKTQCDRRKILDVAYTIIFTSMSVLLYTQADIWILGMFKSPDTVGIYGIASKLVLLVYFPMMAFAAIIPSLISSIHATGDLGELRKMVSESTRWILSMAMPIILILSLEGEYILKFVYGSDFAAGYIPLLILVAGQLIKSCAGLISVILQMTGEHRIYMKITVIWGIINIILNIMLVPRFGMIGAAGATAFCLSMIDIICIFVIHKRLSVLTLARGWKFDIVFISIVASGYMFLNYMNLHMGQHVLLIVALSVYLWKSISHHDIPWKLLTGKYKEG